MTENQTTRIERPIVAQRLERRRRRLAFPHLYLKRRAYGWGYWMRNFERLSWI